MDVLQHALKQASVEVINVDADLDGRIRTLVDDHLRMVGPPRYKVLDSIIQIVRERGVQVIVVEHDYVDADYLETFRHHYSQAFHPKSSHCKRLHFFAKPLVAQALFDLGDGCSEDYLGYCVLRPTGHRYVGRTVVVPPHKPNDDTRFLHAAADFDAHILGQKLIVRGAPFIQQDANTFICAGAALWVVGLFMHTEHRGARFYPAQIAEMARQSFSHGQLRKGLTADQIVMTLRRMGLNPHVESYSSLQHLRSHNPKDHRAVLARLADFIHIFVDSGLPPILAYTTTAGDGHAVVVVGHDIAQRDDVPDEILWGFKKVLRNSYFVDTFFVMDDARGPYAPFHVWTGHDTLIPSLADCDRVVVIAPMPMESALDYHDAITELHKLVYLWNHVYTNPEMNPPEVESGEEIDWSSYEIDDAPDNPIVTRTALLDSRYWKRQVLESALPTWLKRQYQAELLPKFVWVIEISDFASINHPRRSDRQICGELLLDATANPHWPLDSLISFHVKGLLMQRTEDGLSFLRSEEQFCPYAPVLRSI